MGFAQAHRQEERLALTVAGQFIEYLDRASSPFSVAVGIVVDVSHLGGRTLGKIVRVPAPDRALRLECREVRRQGIVRSLDLDPAMPVVGVDPLAFGPVVDLPEADRFIALLAEMPVDRQQVGVPLSPAVDVEGLFPRPGRVEAAHDRKPRGSADRLLAVCPIETHARFGESVHVGGDRAGSVGAQFRSEIVDRDEEHIRLFPNPGGNSQGRGRQKGHGGGSKSHAKGNEFVADATGVAESAA